MYFLRLVFILVLIFGSLPIKAANMQNDKMCSNPKDVSDKHVLTSGWDTWRPYEYSQIGLSGYEILGMDIDLVKIFSEKIGITVKYEYINWSERQKLVSEGKIDMVFGATYTTERAKKMYFSKPYRYEQNSLFIKNNNVKTVDFKSISDLLVQIRMSNFRIGIKKGYLFSSDQLNIFINNNYNRDLIFEYSNTIEAVQALIKGDIDGILSDNVAVASSLLDSKVGNQVYEIPLKILTPIHLMFNKENVSIELVEKYNQVISDFYNSRKYKSIVKTYLYPVMLLGTIDSRWFYFLGVIGSIAFAISGIAIAAQDNATLFGTFLYSMLPSITGGVICGILSNKDDVEVFFTTEYIYYIFITVLVGFFTVRLVRYYSLNISKINTKILSWDKVLFIGDAVGQAVFVVAGVSFTIISKIDPVWLWGPLLAFLIANGGGMVRDLFRNKHYIFCLNGEINAELSVIWGLIFSLYLDINYSNPDPKQIRNVVLLIIICVFSSRVAVRYFNVPNIKFKLGSGSVPDDKSDLK